MLLYLDPEIQQALPRENCFDHIMALQGVTYRELENRRTQRIMLNGNAYFIKQHFGVGWKEIFKNILQGRLPVISAKNEWLAVQKLHTLGVPTLDIAGYGVRGRNPAKQQSFLLTRELSNFITLEDLCKKWRNEPPAAAFKFALIKAVAEIARILHTNGINHRDFYLCHFLMDLIEYNARDAIKLYLIDLHRAGLRQKTPLRWIIKDLAGLDFSSHDIGLTKRDQWRFMKWYRKASLREIIKQEPGFWEKVKARGDRLYQQHGST